VLKFRKAILSVGTKRGIRPTICFFNDQQMVLCVPLFNACCCCTAFQGSKETCFCDLARISDILIWTCLLQRAESVECTVFSRTVGRPVYAMPTHITCEWWVLCFIFGESQIHISARKPVMRMFVVIFLELYSGFVPQIGPRALPSASLPINYSQIITSDALLSEPLMSLNNHPTVTTFTIAGKQFKLQGSSFQVFFSI
jgi:hypothetical protein